MITFQKYSFFCTWTSEALLPIYWGSALRGGLGRWLRKTCCVFRNRKCDDCIVKSSCIYFFIFETENNKYSETVNARPHPIVLEPPLPVPSSTRQGDKFSFSIILIGKANDFLPHLVYSIIQMGKDGIGAKTGHGYGSFTVDTISSDKTVLFDKNGYDLKRPVSLHTLELSNSTIYPCKRLEVEFQTPFRVKYKGRFIDSIPFHILIRAALRRISSLEAAYGTGEPKLDYSNLVAGAKKIEVIDEQIHWQELPRFSSRQKCKMTLGGPVGRVIYEGNIGPYLQFLSYCQPVHLGKQTFFGLGKIKLSNGNLCSGLH